MLLKILLLTFFSFLPSAVRSTPLASKITTGSENRSLSSGNENKDQDSMTLLRPDHINKPPTDEFRRNPSRSRQQGDEENEEEDEAGHPDHQMMGDQPLNDDGFKTISVAPLDEVGDVKNYAEAAGSRNRAASSSTVDPAKTRKLDFDRNQRLREIQNLIPVMTGRGNVTDTSDTTNSTNIDISHLPPIEKIMFFAPECNAPKVAKDSWKEESLLHLYFNVSFNTNATLASAIIKLHRVPREEGQVNSNNGSGEDEEKLLRVSIYWYSKYGKKQRSRKRLCDSKVVADKQSSVELNVKPAVTSWLESQNLGFAVKVENQEENVLKASNYFKGGCKTGPLTNSHPYPLSVGRLSNSSNDIRPKNLHSFTFLGNDMLPEISICTVESITGAPLSEKSVSCQLHKTLYNPIEMEGHRRVQSLIGSAHHLRHQKHLEDNPSRLENHLKKQHLDIRNLIENKTMFMSKDELDRINREGTR